MPDTPVGTNSPNYGPLTSGDLGATIYCKVTATNASGTANADSNTVGPVTAATAGWTPADLGAALIAWYKADTGVYSDAGTTPAAADALVKQWNDQSGGGRHLVQAAPTNIAYKSTGFNSTHPCLLNDYSAGAGLATAVNTVAHGGGAIISMFAVVRSDVDRVDNERLLAYTGTGLTIDNAHTDLASVVLLFYTTGNVNAVQGGDVGAPAPVTVGTNYRIGSVFDGTDHTIYINNTAIGSPVVPAVLPALTSPGQLSLGFSENGVWVGAIAEIVVTNTVLSSGDRTSLDNYFKAKWGLS